jgi:hypothetical protein
MPENRPAQLSLSILSAALCAVVLSTGLALAQAPAPAPAPAPGAAGTGGTGGMPRYDKKTETTLKGPILEVKLVETPGGVQGTHFLLKQGQQTIEVFAGPSVYLTGQGMTFAKGEAVEVIGSRVQVAGIPALLARQIKKGDKTLALRDETGFPAWAKKPQ